MSKPRDVFGSLRAKNPPPGARERVLARVEERLERRPAAGRLLVAFAAASIATAAWAWHGRRVEHARVENAKVQVARYAGRTEPLPFTGAHVTAPPAEVTAPIEAPAEAVVEALAPAETAPVVAPTAVHHKRAPKPVEIPAPIEAPAPSDLALQVEAYRAAQAETDAAAALARYREIKTRWPAGALDTEVDLRIVQTLVRQGHMEEARAAARAFAEAHPQSPQADEMRAFANQ
jgi:hypothetical protein